MDGKIVEVFRKSAKPAQILGFAMLVSLGGLRQSVSQPLRFLPVYPDPVADALQFLPDDLSAPCLETDIASLRSEHFRILLQAAGGFPERSGLLPYGGNMDGNGGKGAAGAAA